MFGETVGKYTKGLLLKSDRQDVAENSKSHHLIDPKRFIFKEAFNVNKACNIGPIITYINYITYIAYVTYIGPSITYLFHSFLLENAFECTEDQTESYYNAYVT